MTDPPVPPRQVTLSAAEAADGERVAEPHDPGPAEQYAGAPVPDPWGPDPAEEVPHGQLGSGALPA